MATETYKNRKFHMKYKKPAKPIRPPDIRWFTDHDVEYLANYESPLGLEFPATKVETRQWSSYDYKWRAKERERLEIAIMVTEREWTTNLPTKVKWQGLHEMRTYEATEDPNIWLLGVISFWFRNFQPIVYKPDQSNTFVNGLVYERDNIKGVEIDLIPQNTKGMFKLPEDIHIPTEIIMPGYECYRKFPPPSKSRGKLKR